MGLNLKSILPDSRFSWGLKNSNLNQRIKNRKDSAVYFVRLSVQTIYLSDTANHFQYLKCYMHPSQFSNYTLA